MKFAPCHAYEASNFEAAPKLLEKNLSTTDLEYTLNDIKDGRREVFCSFHNFRRKHKYLFCETVPTSGYES